MAWGKLILYQILKDMKHILIINAGQNFAHSSGRFNKTITDHTIQFFEQLDDVAIKTTQISEGYDQEEEVAKFVWADYIIYHTPMWWFQVPHDFKKYIDEVFTVGHRKGIYHSDGRTSTNPEINYGTGGMLQGRKYMVTTSWNAPKTAFTLPGEFFNETSVDDGVLFGFHRMNAFASLEKLDGFHFHDVEKNADVVRDMAEYRKHLELVFEAEFAVAK